MSDFFLSYAREDENKAALLARLLESNGVSVWWDRSLVPGERFNEVIDRELELAKAVIVLWSRKSVVSDWVLGEATTAREAGKLAPIKIEDCKLPIPFRAFHTPEVFKDKGELDALARLLSEKFASRSPGGGPAAKPAVSISDASAKSFLGALGSEWTNYREELKVYRGLTWTEAASRGLKWSTWKESFARYPTLIALFCMGYGIALILAANADETDTKYGGAGLFAVGLVWLIYLLAKRSFRS